MSINVNKLNGMTLPPCSNCAATLACSPFFMAKGGVLEQRERESDRRSNAEGENAEGKAPSAIQAYSSLFCVDPNYKLCQRGRLSVEP